MRRQDYNQNHSPRGVIHAALAELRVATDTLQSEVAAFLADANPRGPAMPGGPLQSGWALLAELVCETNDVAAHEELLASILSTALPDGSFPATNGGPSDKGATRFLRAVISYAKAKHGPTLSPQTMQAIGAIEQQPARYYNATGIYNWFGKTHEKLFHPKRTRWFSFPFYAFLGDLFSRYWLFSRLRSRLSESSRILIPCCAAWLHGTARRTRFGRASQSLAERIIALQSPNGSWAWTVLGTAVALVALRELGVAPDHQSIQTGLRYIRELRFRDANGHVYQSWAGGSIWNATIGATALLAHSGLARVEVEKTAVNVSMRKLTARAMEFDSQVGLGDNDTTAVVLTFLARLHRKKDKPGSRIEVFVERTLVTLLATQSRGGGWGFSWSRARKRAGRTPPSEKAARLLDSPSPDITARVLLGLAAARQLPFLDVATRDAIDKSMLRTIEYLKSAQQSDGSWWSRWGDGNTSATSEVLLALCAADEDPKTDFIVAARRWLLSNIVAEARTLSTVELCAGLAAVISCAPSDSIYKDQETLAVLQQLLPHVCHVENVTQQLRFAYPVVYPNERFAAPSYDCASALLNLSFVRTAMERGVGIARRELLWGHRPAKRLPRGDKKEVDLVRIFQTIRAQALWLGGGPADIGQRVVVHYCVYCDSRRNFTFPILALHGAGWAEGYFRFMDLLLSPYATFRHPISSRKRDDLKVRMQRAMEGFKLANRRVLSDTFANYYFSKAYGREAGADRILAPDLLSQLNALHETIERGELMSPSAKAKLYSDSFQWEQANSVWPMVERTIRDVNDPIVTFIAFKPIVKFAYFPYLKFLFFSDFTKTEERITEGWKAYRLAERVGWAQTERAMRKYRFLPVDLPARSTILLNWATELADLSNPKDPLEP